MDVTLMLFWSLLTIGVLTIIFSNSIARYITTQKLKKLEAEQNVKKPEAKKTKEKKTKEAELEEQKYLQKNFDSTFEYKNDIIVKYLELGKDFLSNVNVDTKSIQLKVDNLIKVFSVSDVITEKQDINTATRGVIFFLGTLEEFKKVYLTNEKIGKLDTNSTTNSISKLEENVDSAISTIDAIYDEIATKNNTVFIKQTEAVTETINALNNKKTE